MGRVEGMRGDRGVRLRRWLGVAALLCLLGTADVLAQEAGSPELVRAERLYAEGSYDEVIGLLSPFLAGEMTPAQEQAGYRLVILSYLQKQQLPDAKRAAVKLLSLHPGYEPDAIEDPPFYASFMGEVRQQLLATSEMAASCEQLLDQGEGKYLEGDFDEAVRLATNCLFTASPSAAQMEQGYRLLALSYLQRGDVGEARSMVQRLLNLQPGYEPDPIEDPPAYVALVGLVREQSQALATEAAEPQGEGPARERRSWFRSPRGWAIVGSGLLVTGVTAVLTMTGGDSGGERGEPLPLPPDFPN